MMTQLNPPVPLKTPKGDAWAVAIIDYGPQWDLCWVTFIEQTGECWTFRNPEVRQGANYTFNHPQPTTIRPRVPLTQKDAPVETPMRSDMNSASFTGAENAVGEVLYVAPKSERKN